MKPLFTYSKSAADHWHYVHARLLTLDDFQDIEPTNRLATIEKPYPEHWPHSTHHGVKLVLRPEIVKEIEEHNDKVGKSGSYKCVLLRDRWGFQNTSTVEDTYVVSAHREVSYKGCRTPQSKAKKYVALHEECRTEFEKNREEMIQTKLDELNETIQENVTSLRETCIKNHVEYFSSLKDTSIEDMDKEAGSAQLSEEIDRLQKRVHELEEARRNAWIAYNLKIWRDDTEVSEEIREAVIAKLESGDAFHKTGIIIGSGRRRKGKS